MDSFIFTCVTYITVLLLSKGCALSTTLTVDVNDVFVNSNITFTCSTSSPAVAVLWYKTDQGSRNEDEIIGQRWFEGNKTCASTNNAMDCNCYSSQVFKCSIQSVTWANDGQSWSCKAVINSVYIHSNSFTFRLMRPITSVVINPASQSVFPIFNVTSTFICITSLSRPGASIQWFNDGVNITHLAAYSYNDDVAISSLQYTPSFYDYRGGNLSCVARYMFATYNTVLTANKIFRVQFPVSQPIVTVNNINISATFNVREGRLVHLKCFSTGYPPPSYHWIYLSGESTGAFLNITFTRNNGSIACRSFHSIYTLNGTSNTHVKEKNIVLNIRVLYPPAIPSFSYQDINVHVIGSTIKLLRGDNINIHCTSDANPPASVTWLRQHINSSTLTVSNIQQDTVFTCQAKNSMAEFDGTLSTESATQNLSAKILYSPHVQRLQNQTVLLNTSLTVFCNLTDSGNPPASTFQWIRKDTGKVVGTKQTLTINNIGLTDKGEYQCSASNKMQPTGNEVVTGLSQTTFFLNVKYGAYVRTFKANESHSSFMADQGNSIELLCDADGDPEPVVRIFNTTSGDPHILVETEGREADVIIQQARCEYDTGNYACVANNHYNEGKELLNLFIQCSPRASPFAPPITQLYGAPNDVVEFTFTIIAYPKPTSPDFVWYKRDDDSWRMLTDDSNFIVHVSENSMQTQLRISQVKLADYTDYMVNVSNKVGSAVEVFTLKAQSQPDVPTELQVSRSGKAELVVEWIPGFNGGTHQTFTIRYKEFEYGSWIVIPINISKLKWTIDGLKSGTTYQIQILAENKIGRSDWTQEIHETTLMDTDSNSSSTSAVGWAVGGVLGCVFVIAVSILTWRYRAHGLNIKTKDITNCNSVGKYEDLNWEPGDNDTSPTDGSYETCRLDSSQSRHATQYETLAELECCEYSKISTYSVQLETAKISAPVKTDVSTNDQDYVNLQLFSK